MNKNNTNAVPLNTTTFNTRLLNTTKLNTNGFPVLSKRSGSSADISQAITDSLVCWYDPGKQQCTNESMAANPVLADLSGNGHDITCYNFAWAGMSGIGGYSVDFTDYATETDTLKTQDKIIIYNTDESHNGIWNFIYLRSQGQITYPQFKVKISGLAEGETITYRYYEGENLSIKHNIVMGNGIYDIPKIEANITADDNSFHTISEFILNDIRYKNIIVEQLALYPNALVSDGVDDYCYTNGLPILTDYTVIAKRKILNTNVVNVSSGFSDLACKGTNQGAFLFERFEGNVEGVVNHSFGYVNKNDLQLDDISYQTTLSYNGSQLIKGTLVDVNDLQLLSRSSKSGFIQAALYSFLLFDRTLTTAEIEWVKQNMIESGGVLATNWADSSLWAFYNLSNQSRIDGTISNNRMVIAANGERTDVSVTAKFMECIVQNSIVPAYKIKVTGLKNGIILNYVDNTIHVEMAEDGIYNIPEHNTQNRYFGFSFNKAFENENIVIQQLLSE